MATQPKEVHSVDEFRRLYYPEPEPVLDYFNGSRPQSETDAVDADTVSVDPLDLFARVLAERR
jgi:hypothetical protein